jgi:hypothetical protein
LGADVGARHALPLRGHARCIAPPSQPESVTPFANRRGEVASAHRVLGPVGNPHAATTAAAAVSAGGRPGGARPQP